jgi:hypothetical protein
MGWIRLPQRLPAPAGPDDAAEVGAWAPVQPATATRVTHRDSTTGPLVYGDEAPLLAGYRHCHARLGSSGNHSWYRLELRAKQDVGTVQSGTYLALAEHPYSNGWTQRTTFKPPCKKGAGARPDPSAQSFTDTRDLIQWVESFPFDYWEKGRFLTAGVSEPSLPQEDADRLRSWKVGAVIALGVCADFEAFEAQLIGSADARHLLEQTAANRIVFWKQGVGPVKLFDEVIAESSALLLLATRQALAGLRDDPGRWCGRPVTDRMREIYCEHLNRLNRRVKRRRDADAKRRADVPLPRGLRHRPSPPKD